MSIVNGQAKHNKKNQQTCVNQIVCVEMFFL